MTPLNALPETHTDWMTMSETERMRPHYETQVGDTYFVKRVGWKYEVWFSREDKEPGEWRALHVLRFWKELSAHRVAQSLQIASNQAYWWRSRMEDVETEASEVEEASVGSMRHCCDDGGVVMVACGKCSGIGCGFCDGFGHFNRPVRTDGKEDPSELIAANNWRLDQRRIKDLRETLQWYAEQASKARLIHSEGDLGRRLLAEDGGKRACAALEAKYAPA